VKKPELVLIKSYLDKAVRIIYYSATEEDFKVLTELKELKRSPSREAFTNAN